MILFIWRVSLQIFCQVSKLCCAAISNACTIGLGGCVGLLGYPFIYCCWYITRGISPVGPRSKRIDRDPCWTDQFSRLPCSTYEWQFACGYKSYHITDSLALKQGKVVTLAGDPIGRDIWINVEATSLSKVVDENLVQRMACGGRPFGFLPSKNPNR
jgi:hypothetical protein